MLPVSSALDVVNRGAAHAVKFTDCDESHARLQKFSDLLDSRFSELGLRRLFALQGLPIQHIVGVPHVFLVRHPFEVLKSIVVPYAVLVVQFVSRWIWRKKRERKQSVNLSPSSYFPVLERHLPVAAQVNELLNDAARRANWVRCSLDARQIADGVVWKLLDFFPALGRNCFRHAWPFTSRLRLFRCAPQLRPLLGVPTI